MRQYIITYKIPTERRVEDLTVDADCLISAVYLADEKLSMRYPDFRIVRAVPLATWEEQEAELVERVRTEQ
jgi:hypothetical protein